MGIADVENTLLTHFSDLLDQQTLLALSAKQAEEPFILALVNLLTILDVDDALKLTVANLLDATILQAFNSYKDFRGEQQYGILLENLTSITTGAIEENTTNLLDATILQAFRNYKDFRGEQQYGILLNNLTSITASGLGSRTAIALDTAVRSGIDIYTAPTYYRYTVDIGPFVNIQASGIASRVASAISSGISSGLAQAERQSLSQQYSQESSSPVDRYTPRNGF